MIVCSLCAIVRTVHSANSCRIVCCMRASVFMSTAAVASSNTNILVFLKMLLAKDINCFCPTLKNVNKININKTKNKTKETTTKKKKEKKKAKTTKQNKKKNKRKSYKYNIILPKQC